MEELLPPPVQYPPIRSNGSAAPATVDSHKGVPSEKVVINDEYQHYINAISGMADKYWNGNQSLLKNQRFIGMQAMTAYF